PTNQINHLVCGKLFPCDKSCIAGFVAQSHDVASSYLRDSSMSRAAMQLRTCKLPDWDFAMSSEIVLAKLQLRSCDFATPTHPSGIFRRRRLPRQCIKLRDPTNYWMISNIDESRSTCQTLHR